MDKHLNQEVDIHIDTEGVPLLLTRSEAWRFSGLDENYLDRLRRCGDLKTYKTKGGHHRFFRDDLINHIKTNAQRLQN
jgi:hypothetical protein